MAVHRRVDLFGHHGRDATHTFQQIKLGKPTGGEEAWRKGRGNGGPTPSRHDGGGSNDGGREAQKEDVLDGAHQYLGDFS